MARVEIVRNEIADGALARRFERELVAAVSLTGSSDATLSCAILDEGLHAEIEIDMPGWTDRVVVPYPSRVGDVRRAVCRLLRDLGLVEETDRFHLMEHARGL
jgi:hypothetical protein